jgi:hypothetical protein
MSAAAMSDVQRAIEALKHSAATLGYVDEGWCEPDEERRTEPPLVERYSVSKDGNAVILRLTPDQVLRLVDLVANDLD